MTLLVCRGAVAGTTNGIRVNNEVLAITINLWFLRATGDVNNPKDEIIAMSIPIQGLFIDIRRLWSSTSCWVPREKLLISPRQFRSQSPRLSLFEEHD
mmetsp:Transcript_28234/g.45446  ORF Transcript_28234/g.45446 Transcript_28234/m.45446 type:complete len:98 (+) Transcript_28234:716-1009(+)